MNTRDLIILLLGLAIVVIMLRGLYVAMQARRRQLRLAIERNIPHDVDLDRIEMAELPGGGARIIRRGLATAMQTPDTLADSSQAPISAASLGIEEGDEHVPVLMDAVELVERDPPVIRRKPLPVRKQGESDFGETADDVLLDYGEEADDYQGGKPGGDHWSEEQVEALAEAWAEPAEAAVAEVRAAAAADHESTWEEEDSDELTFSGEELDDNTPEFGDMGGLESELSAFSMTAGERIGFEEPPPQPATQAESFSENQDITPNSDGAEADDAHPAANDSLDASAEVIDPGPPATGAEPAFEPSEVVVMNVMAGPRGDFAGDDLVQAMITTGLQYGEMDIFHQRLDNDPAGDIVFSVANILNPGTFDLDAMGDFSTPGVSLFLALPSPINNFEAFERMLNVAQQLRGALDADLKDDNRNVMTAQTIEHYRQRIRDFELRRLKASAGRG